MIVSAASNAFKAHYREDSESFVYRCCSSDSHYDNREMRSRRRWDLVTNGLPESKGTIISILKSNSKIKDEFYCLNNKGIYCSTDSGISWDIIDIPWSKEYYLQHPWSLAIKG